MCAVRGARIPSFLLLEVDLVASVLGGTHRRCPVPPRAATRQIRLHVEVGEQGEEDERVGEDPPGEHGRIGAVFEEEELAGMQRHADELQDLRTSHVALPPEQVLIARPQRRQEVVHVHEEVDEGVEHRVERPEAACGRQKVPEGFSFFQSRRKFLNLELSKQRAMTWKKMSKAGVT